VHHHYASSFVNQNSREALNQDNDEDEVEEVNRSNPNICVQQLFEEQEYDLRGAAANDRVHSMGERASTTSSIFHHNMFFMNCDFDKQEVAAADS
jgi:hypothetical protein